MKFIKFDHTLAQLVQNGEKTSTWRLFDDKDLSVGDDVRMIDKVDPSRPETWKVLGVARIEAIVQKRLCDIEDGDYEGHEAFSSKEQMLKTYQGYYGSNVNLNTIVKIIRFTFNNDKHVREEIGVHNTSQFKELNMYADGGSRGNPGPSALGYALIDMTGNIVVKKGTYLGITTNNQAEYQALRAGLEEAERMNVGIVHVYMDSLLVVNQMLGIFKVKNRDLWPIHAAIKERLDHFEKVTFTHVPRQLNKIADAAVNEALDAAASN